jgi:hypothetical protein
MQDTLATLTTAAIPEWSTMTPVRKGITGGRTATLATPDGTPQRVMVKRTAHGMSIEAERLAYIVSTLTPGLVDIPATVLRTTPDGYGVMVQAWRDGGHNVWTLRECLRSDVVGLAAYDWIVGNADRHPGNGLQVPTGHYHHDRIVAIDHGAAFAGHGTPDPRLAVGVMSGLRVPHYIHDHAARIVGGAATLMAEASRLGMVAEAMTTLETADAWTRMATYPDAGRRW